MKPHLRTIFNKTLLLRQTAIEEITAVALSENFAISQSEMDAQDSTLIQRIEGLTGVVEINGVICNKGSWISLIFGESPINLIKTAIQSFLDNPKITRILLLLDSPGGFVDGVKELSDFIFESRDKKEIIALADPMACSAAYWIGSAASKFYISSPLSEVGSIGVYRMHQDISGALGKAGIKVTEISSGKYKTLGSPYKPLDDESVAILGESVLYTHELFVEAVQRNRGISAEEAKALADGRVYFGSKAINLKLVDGIMSKDKIEKSEDELEEDEKAMGGDDEEDEEKAEKEDDEEKAEAEELDEEEEEKALRKRNPAACKRLFQKGLKAGVKRERARIQSIEEITNEGFEKEATDYKFKNGKSAEMFASYQLKEIKNRGGVTPQGLRDTRGQQVPFSHAKPEQVNSEVQQFQNEVVAQAETMGKQLASEFKGDKFKLN